MEIQSKNIWVTEAVIFDESKQLYLEKSCTSSDLQSYLAEEPERTLWIKRGKVTIGCDLNLGKRQISLFAGVEVVLWAMPLFLILKMSWFQLKEAMPITLFNTELLSFFVIWSPGFHLWLEVWSSPHYTMFFSTLISSLYCQKAVQVKPQIYGMFVTVEIANLIWKGKGR